MLDSLKYVKKLERSGMTRKQAEAYMTIMTEIMNTQLASHQDVVDLKVSMGHQIELVGKDMAQMEQRLLIRLGSIACASATISTGIIGTLLYIMMG